jgi:L-alanine-DL-glutamate epimerase-like enolase superfamily enzyme
MPPRLAVRVERWPIAGRFTISRGSKTEATTVVAEIREGDRRGRGECVPYARYVETVGGRHGRPDEADSAQADRSSIRRHCPRRHPRRCPLWDFWQSRGKRA